MNPRSRSRIRTRCRRRSWGRIVLSASIVLGAALADFGCSGDEEHVVVYTALDRVFSEPIFAEFTRETGIAVRAVYDTESTKTVGLANRIRAERDRPRCDVFWNNEILNTLLLDRDGLFAACEPAPAMEYDEKWRDSEGHWFGFAARARVLIVNTNLVPADQRPDSIEDLTDPRWKGRAGMAKPLFGTTASHVACLFAKLGTGAATKLLERIHENDVRILSGNKACAEEVGAGRLAFALTDTDDAMIELDAGRPVAIVWPDSKPGEMGTPVLPNTLARIRGAPNPEAAVKLISFLLTPKIEAMLARGPSAQIPLHRETAVKPRIPRIDELRPMDIDFEEAAAAFSKGREAVEVLLLD